jgi:hypothetical protein
MGYAPKVEARTFPATIDIEHAQAGNGSLKQMGNRAPSLHFSDITGFRPYETTFSDARSSQGH